MSLLTFYSKQIIEWYYQWLYVKHKCYKSEPKRQGKDKTVIAADVGLEMMFFMPFPCVSSRTYSWKIPIPVSTNIHNTK